MIVACSTSNHPPEVHCPIGQVDTAPPQIEIVYKGLDGGWVETSSGAHVPLINPTQGGHIMYFSARAKNMDGCPLVITVALRDPCTQRLLVLDTRRITLVEGTDGWGAPDRPTTPANYSNYPACPQAGIHRNIEDEPYIVEMTAVDGAGRMAQASRRIVPVCTDPTLALCECDCDANYTPDPVCHHTDSGLPSGVCPSKDAGP